MIYTNTPQACRRRKTFPWSEYSYLIADTREELLAFAAKLGLRPTWASTRADVRTHFAVSRFVYVKAVARGAEILSLREMVGLLRIPNNITAVEALAAWRGSPASDVSRETEA